MLGPTEAWIEELGRCRDANRAAQLVKELNRDIEELVAWMNKAWAWLDRNPGAPGFWERETRLIERIRLYVKAVDAVRIEEAA